jgi:isoleucyl-tRNA synthetase
MHRRHRQRTVREITICGVTVDAEQIGRLDAPSSVIQAAIELQVQAKAFNKNNEADVTVTLPADHPCYEVLQDDEFVKEFFIVAGLTVVVGDEVSATAKATEHCMCPRCRRYEPLVSDVCQRCNDVV